MKRKPTGKSRRTPRVVPERFTSIEEASEFWDSHDLTDYWPLTRDAKFQVGIERRVFLTALAPEVAKRLAHYARKRGVSTETLINVWLAEKLAGTN